MKIDIIGRGNVATHLYNALSNVSDVMIVDPHRPNCSRVDCNLCIICVSDNVIEKIASQLADHNAIIVHTSGSIPMSVLAREKAGYGVFYPLQTFTKGTELNYSEIPFFIEASDAQTRDVLRNVASLITNKLYDADSEARKRLHLASVFACNYVNHMFYIADEILRESSFDLSVLIPLINQTVEKVTKITPYNAQTGPARRGDSEVTDKHINMLSDKPDLANIYSSLANSIRKLYLSDRE